MALFRPFIRFLVFAALPFAYATAQIPSGQAAGNTATIPIRKVQLPNGGRFFALPVRVGAENLFAAIDTGSFGLRVLTRALRPGDFNATKEKATLTFVSGTTIDGFRATAQVAFGAVSGPVTIEVITDVHCDSNHPKCTEGHMSMQDVGMMGSSIPHQGAPAIIGLAASNAPVTVPFPALGVKQWIVDIPNDAEPGKLVLNPSPADLAGFVKLPFPEGIVEGVRGCLENDKTHRQICGTIRFDTGAPGISVDSPDALPSSWPPGTAASLLYQDLSGKVLLRQQFRTGDPAHSSRLSFRQDAGSKRTVIHANASPYFCFDVLYEADHRSLSLRPRRSGRSDPHGTIVGAGADR